MNLMEKVGEKRIIIENIILIIVDCLLLTVLGWVVLPTGLEKTEFRSQSAKKNFQIKLLTNKKF